jgi:sortase B
VSGGVVNLLNVLKGSGGGKGSARRAVWLVVFACSACLMLFSGYKLVSGQIERGRALDTYADIADTFVKPPTQPAPTLAPPPEDTPDAHPRPTVSAPPAAPQQTEPETPTPTPTPTFVDQPAPAYWPVVDFAGLQSVNQDITAWLACAGTNVNYPVARGQDNEYYLKHMFNHARNGAGTLFMDYRNAPDFTDRHTIIYGHNMNNHSMFWTITQYKSQSYYNAHPVFMLVTPEGNYEIQLFAGYIVGTGDDAWRLEFVSDEDYYSWIESSWARSTFSANIPLSAEDRVVTLATCTYEYTDARYVLVGKLVPA